MRLQPQRTRRDAGGMFDTIKGVNVKGVNVRFLQFIQWLNLTVTLRSGLAQSAANLAGFLVTSRTPDTIDIPVISKRELISKLRCMVLRAN